MNYLEKDVNQQLKRNWGQEYFLNGSGNNFRLYEEFSIIVCEFKEFFCGCLNNVGVFSIALANQRREIIKSESPHLQDRSPENLGRLNQVQ